MSLLESDRSLVLVSYDVSKGSRAAAARVAHLIFGRKDVPFPRTPTVHRAPGCRAAWPVGPPSTRARRGRPRREAEGPGGRRDHGVDHHGPGWDRGLSFAGPPGAPRVSM